MHYPLFRHHEKLNPLTKKSLEKHNNSIWSPPLVQNSHVKSIRLQIIRHMLLHWYHLISSQMAMPIFCVHYTMYKAFTFKALIQIFFKVLYFCALWILCSKFFFFFFPQWAFCISALHQVFMLETRACFSLKFFIFVFSGSSRLNFFSHYSKLALCIFALYQVFKLKALIHFSLAFHVYTH